MFGVNPQEPVSTVRGRDAVKLAELAIQTRVGRGCSIRPHSFHRGSETYFKGPAAVPETFYALGYFSRSAERCEHAYVRVGIQVRRPFGGSKIDFVDRPFRHLNLSQS